ncbi:uncharacterized protein LOC141917531 isoform X3 [Strix aluco]|uniref:uncharacterized protein LOC141917531 isoform X3 n=1 Tax=Strix aluco TaxID=111821 RepID=UPI003DA61853
MKKSMRRKKRTRRKIAPPGQYVRGLGGLPRPGARLEAPGNRPQIRSLPRPRGHPVPEESRQMAPAGRAPCGAPPPRPGGASGRGDSGRGPAPTGSDPTSPPPPAHLQAVPPGPPPGGHGNVRPPPAPAHPQVVPPGPPPGGHSSVLHRLPEPLPGRVSPHRVPLALPHLPPGAIPLLLLLRAFISSPSACSPSAFSLCFNSSSSSSSSSFPFYSCSSSFHSYSPSSSPSYSPSSFHS